MRTRLRLAVLLTTFALVAAACGDDGDSADGAGAGRDDGGAATADRQPAGGTFPTEVEHRYGTTEVEEAPERVVTLGFSDQDAVLALGVVPVAVTDWYGDYPSSTWPWAQDELGDGESEVLNEGQFNGEQAFDYERIAALDPDLVIGFYTGMTEEEYDTLSQIAPTVAPSGEYPDYGMPWQEATRMAGDALGRADRAEELVADVEALFADAAEANPAFAGQQAVVVEAFEPGSTFVRSATDPRTVFMTSLGFELPEDIAELAGDLDGAELSDERMDLLDRDLIVWNVGVDPGLRAEIEGKPLYPRLDAVREGRELFIEDPLVSGALTWSTVLSLPYAIEHLVPQLAEVVEGGATGGEGGGG
jgi:iron complex transport system substrate-binding protein